MKKLFVLLRQGNLEEIKRILTEKPELLDCVAGSVPKKDHGQSLLQVALKSGHFDICRLSDRQGYRCGLYGSRRRGPRTQSTGFV